MESLVSSSDQIVAELEQSTDERLSAHRNTASALQGKKQLYFLMLPIFFRFISSTMKIKFGSKSLTGQIDLIRSHQSCQDRRINFALAREAEEADGRANDRLACSSFLFTIDYFSKLSCGVCCFGFIYIFFVFWVLIDWFLT